MSWSEDDQIWPWRRVDVPLNYAQSSMAQLLMLSVNVLKRSLLTNRSSVQKTVRKRERHVPGLFCVRALAGRYLGLGQHRILLGKTVQGQPRLIDPRNSGSHRLNVSWSHCVKGVAIAFARQGQVGVDLDIHRPPGATAAVARLLTGTERALTAAPQVWDCWARKEALLKGLGLGLSGLHAAPPLAHQTNAVRAGVSLWTVTSLAYDAGCSLACATEGNRRRIKVFNYKSWTTFNRSLSCNSNSFASYSAC